MKSPTLAIIIVIVILVIAGVAYWAYVPKAQAPTATTTPATTQATGTTSVSTGNVMLRPYTDAGKTFTLNYPNAFTFNGPEAAPSQDWMLNASANGSLLVKLTLPKSTQPNTNFVDATLTVGSSSSPGAVSQCLSVAAQGLPSQKSTVTINGTQYTKFTYSDAAAGNRYDTTSYRTIHNGQCYVIEYTIHSGNIQNYPPNSGITQFNPTPVQNALETVVQSFKFLS